MIPLVMLQSGALRSNNRLGCVYKPLISALTVVMKFSRGKLTRTCYTFLFETRKLFQGVHAKLFAGGVLRGTDGRADGTIGLVSS